MRGFGYGFVLRLVGIVVIRFWRMGDLKWFCLVTRFGFCETRSLLCPICVLFDGAGILLLF